ncbi:MAG TPA: site-specific integrase [Aggregatilineales bacterium]|nr:site-specific integrase [Aggregatilineales bacterium]
MTHALITLPTNQVISKPEDGDWKLLIEATLQTVAPSSARIYRRTFMAWARWCEQHQADPLGLYANPVNTFLAEQSVSAPTRQRQLSALRKLARVLATLDFNTPARRAAYESLLLLRAPKSDLPAPQERSRRALKPAEVDKVLRVWEGEQLRQKRNRALIAVLFLTGLRRAEAAALRWADIDLSEGILHVRHGKGDTSRDVALAGDLAVEALRVWQQAQGTDREFVFCPLLKGDRLGPDKPIITQAVYQVVQATAEQAGIVFSPHDARRTLITEALTTGTPLADVQAQAGHRQESTTLRYARPVAAKQRRERLRLRYG